MNEVERWIYLDGPEPERIRPLLDALRDLPPASPQDKERRARAFFEKLDASLQREPAPEGAADGQQMQAEPSAGVAEDEPPRRASARLVGEEADAPLPEEPAPARAAAVTSAPEALTSTAPLVNLPAEVWREAGKLPFKPASPEQPAPPAPGRGKAITLKVPVMQDLGDTLPLEDDSIQKAIASLPFIVSTVGEAIVHFPRLKLEEYTSLCAELSVRPERSAEILLRYQVQSKAAHRALDEHWQEHFAAHPEARAAFEKDLAQYTAWLRMQRR